MRIVFFCNCFIELKRMKASFNKTITEKEELISTLQTKIDNIRSNLQLSAITLEKKQEELIICMKKHIINIVDETMEQQWRRIRINHTDVGSTDSTISNNEPMVKNVPIELEDDMEFLIGRSFDEDDIELIGSFNSYLWSWF